MVGGDLGDERLGRRLIGVRLLPLASDSLCLWGLAPLPLSSSYSEVSAGNLASDERSARSRLQGGLDALADTSL